MLSISPQKASTPVQTLTSSRSPLHSFSVVVVVVVVVDVAVVIVVIVAVVVVVVVAEVVVTPQRPHMATHVLRRKAATPDPASHWSGVYLSPQNDGSATPSQTWGEVVVVVTVE